ncbi:MAG: hypothetical protein P1U90_10935 [Akkermansiaceae bacterium]|nr:hypothetical protein [Akkermansiaceae bacterium]
MMRWLFLLGWLVLAGCDCERPGKETPVDDGLSIRSYAVDEGQLRDLYRKTEREDLGFDADGWVQPLEGKFFESRFLEGEGKRGECTKLIGDILGDGFEGRAIYDFDEGVLVVKAGLRHQGVLQYLLRHEVIRMVKTEVAIYKGGEPGEYGRRGGEVFRQSMVAWPGVNWSSSGMNGMVALSGESQIAAGDVFIESRIKVVSSVEGMDFELEAGFELPHGRPRWLGEVLDDGQELIKVVVTSDLVTMNGASLYDWVLTEETGKRPGYGTRPVAEVKEEFLKFEKGESVRRIWDVFPSFATFITMSGVPVEESEEPDPFAGGFEIEDDERPPPPVYVGNDPDLAELKKKGARDLKVLLQENGVSFRPGDFALLLEEPPVLFAQVDPIAGVLIDGIIQGGFFDIPYSGFCEVMVLESEKALNQKTISDGNYRIVKRAGVFAYGAGKFRVKDDFRGTVEVRPDASDEMMEVRVDLEIRDDGEVVDVVMSSVVLENGGLPVIISQSKGDRGWRSVVIQAWGRWGDRELGE